MASSTAAALTDDAALRRLNTAQRGRFFSRMSIAIVRTVL
jgi:hypothetical protein